MMMRLQPKAALTLLLAAFAVLSACNQDAIFYGISQEVKPLEARIKGNPTNMVVFRRNGTDLMFVAAGSSLYWYNQAGWDSNGFGLSSPGGSIYYLAAGSSHLYAATSGGLKRINNTTGGWQDVDSQVYQTIFAPGNGEIYAGRGNEIYWFKDVPSTSVTVQKINSPAPGLLTGAAWDKTSCYLSTYSGILKFTTGSGTVSKILSGSQFMSIVSMENSGQSQVIALRRDGQFFDAASAVSVKSLGDLGKTALAVWRDSGGTVKLLLAGVDHTSSGYSYGYKEIVAGSDGKISGASAGPREPGTYPTSADNKSLYDSTIAKYPVNYLFQVPASVDSNRILFASTVNQGLWSYRSRNNKEHQWNAEE